MTIKKKRSLRKVAQVQPEDVRYPALDATLEEMDRIQRDWAAGKQKFLGLEAWAIKFMRDKGIDKYAGVNFAGTYVAPVGEEVDWDGIERTLGPKLWAQILGEPMPVKEKLDALIELKQVDPALLMDFIRDKPTKEYIRLTQVKK